MKYNIGDKVSILDKVSMKFGRVGEIISAYEHEPDNPNGYAILVDGIKIYLHEDEIIRLNDRY